MIKKNNITKSIIVFTGAAAMLLTFALVARAESTSTAVPKSSTSSAALARVIASGDSAIAKRITALNNLSTKVGGMKNVSDSEKSAISAEVQTQIANLTALKTKIDLDTDVTVARSDVKTITGNYRIYALVIPQGYILTASDRISTVVGLMTAIQTKLQTRITDAQTKGKDVTTLQTALSDIGAKMSDATAQSQLAQSGVASLVPDQADTTLAASNKAALLAARANLKNASQDLQAARKDISTIISALRAMNLDTPATRAPSTSTR